MKCTVYSYDAANVAVFLLLTWVYREKLTNARRRRTMKTPNEPRESRTREENMQTLAATRGFRNK